MITSVKVFRVIIYNKGLLLLSTLGDDSEANVGWIVSRSTWGAQMPIGVLDVNVTPLERVIVASSGTKGCFTLPTCALQVSLDVYINTSILFEYVMEVSLANEEI